MHSRVSISRKNDDFYFNVNDGLELFEELEFIKKNVDDFLSKLDEECHGEIYINYRGVVTKYSEYLQ